MRGAVARAARGVVRGRLARVRASRGACMRRALLPVRRCSSSQVVQHLRRRCQWELLLLPLLLLLVWLELLLLPLLVGPRDPEPSWTSPLGERPRPPLHLARMVPKTDAERSVSALGGECMKGSTCELQNNAEDDACPFPRSATRAEINMSTPRVVNLGLPHTGTTSVHTSLFGLGCCFAVHNQPMRYVAPLAQRLDCCPPAKHLGLYTRASLSGCEAELLREYLYHWQCVGDNPWAAHWQLLVRYSPPGSLFVLTRFPTALHHGLSMEMGLTPAMVSHARAGYEHIRQVRTALRGSPYYIEICYKCGDDASVLARALHELDRKGAIQLVGKQTLPLEVVSRTHANSGGEQKEKQLAGLLRKGHASLCNHSQRWAWLCDPNYGDGDLLLPLDKNYTTPWLATPHLGGLRAAPSSLPKRTETQSRTTPRRGCQQTTPRRGGQHRPARRTRSASRVTQLCGRLSDRAARGT